MKKIQFLILIIFLIFIPLSALSQKSFISGSIGTKRDFYKNLKTTIILYNNTFKDTVYEDSKDGFVLKNIAYGKYNLKIDNTQMGLKNLLITDIIIDKDSIKLLPIKLHKIFTCGCGAFVLGVKDTIEYYDSGEVYGKGRYYISRKYYRKFKSRLYSYKKDSIWNYFYKEGNLSERRLYDKGEVTSFTEFHKNGTKKLTGYYNEGCKSNIWEYYSDLGELIIKVDFLKSNTIIIENVYLEKYMENFDLVDKW